MWTGENCSVLPTCLCWFFLFFFFIRPLVEYGATSFCVTIDSDLIIDCFFNPFAWGYDDAFCCWLLLSLLPALSGLNETIAADCWVQKWQQNKNFRISFIGTRFHEMHALTPLEYLADLVMTTRWPNSDGNNTSLLTTRRAREMPISRRCCVAYYLNCNTTRHTLVPS